MQAGNEGSYPVSLMGELDPNLSRWLWLVKWLLAIPHFVILLFLWIAFLGSSIFAFFGILFTGRYPPGLFNFNVGVLRWHWRVAFLLPERAGHGSVSSLQPKTSGLPGHAGD